MPLRPGFDNDRYLEEQARAIRERVRQFPHKLYLEFGGKLLFDHHAARVLPGFDPNVKMRLLKGLGEESEVLLCIHAGDIERRKLRADFGITYDADAMKLVDDLGDWGIGVRAVVVTRFAGQPAAQAFVQQLLHRGIEVHTHPATPGYPSDVDLVVSAQGYGGNSFVPTHKPLVVVTGPGPGSGKLATCLSQLYHEHRRGVRAGYAKFETFPIWNLPLKHPVNVAYEAATAELGDTIRIDHFHLEAYGFPAVNYNRDLEAFPLLKRIIERITGGNSFYASPTDMGVNRAAWGITDDEAVREAGRQEVIRRYFRYACEHALGLVEPAAVQRVQLLMDELGLVPEDRPVVGPARRAAEEARAMGKGNNGIYCGAALELPDGTIVTGCNSPRMHASAALVLNAAKHLAGIPPGVDLLPPQVVQAIAHLKTDVLGRRRSSLDAEEAMIALAISAAWSPGAQAAVAVLRHLRGCEVHLTHLPTAGDEAGLRKLGVNLTSEPRFASQRLFAR